MLVKMRNIAANSTPSQLPSKRAIKKKTTAGKKPRMGID